ncbi:MAG TPA: hypothetical protein DCF63_18845 [Planctomycetaceae bacterium]|nr:hypothetical protein [Planctomycetaceae bacterium]
MRTFHLLRFAWVSVLVATVLQSSVWAEYPPFDKVTEGFKKIEPPSSDSSSMYSVYVKADTGDVLLELPKSYATKKYFIGLTVASGQMFAGLQAGDFYVQWREYNKRLALIEPNTSIRSGGDNESKDSVNRLFTGNVLLDVPILTLSPTGGPVIDGRNVLVGNASVFFGPSGRSKNPALAKLVKTKVFKQNIELAFELPNPMGSLQTLYYSISEIPEATDYQPRIADQRVGYFTTNYSDYGKYKRDEVVVNYINRWHLKKRDPSLKVSPPVEPIMFYIEHTTPVRYRRWVKQGIEHWNAAFEKIGLSDAIVVHYQDKTTGAHMEKDPEDVRYNFVRWLNNNVGMAIGPSRVHPESGQILDADIILTDGWIRHYNNNFTDFIPLLSMEGINAEALSWLADHPNWDPRIRFAQATRRRQLQAEIQAKASRDPFQGRSRLMGLDELDGLVGRTSQVNGYCMAPESKRIDTALMQMYLEIGSQALLADDPQEAAADDGLSGTWDLTISGIPEVGEAEASATLQLEADGSVTGSIIVMSEQGVISYGRWDAKTRQLEIEFSPPGVPDGSKGVLSGKVDNDTIEGQWSIDIGGAKITGSFKGSRTAKAATKVQETKTEKTEAMTDVDSDEKPKNGEAESPKKDEATKDEAKKDSSPASDESLLDGMPESFVGPLLADLVAHEVGHTLGLRHNFKASSLYTLAEVNSESIKGKKPLAASVMDYLPINLRMQTGELQGDYSMIGIGPYDFWAIEYGYTFEKNLDAILARSIEPELQFATDEDTLGPDPLARRYDFSSNPLEYAKEQSLLIEKFRKRIMDHYVKKGDSWTKAREGYELTLGLQSRNSSMMSNWLGGTFVNRDKKGDANERLPIAVVPAQDQRNALNFVLESTFRDSSYSLSPELLSRLTKDFMDGSFGRDPTWPVHDRILSMQSATLTQLMNPTTLRRVYDNEFRIAADQDALTLPELLNAISGEIWSELNSEVTQKHSDRAPVISSLRRNLQNEHAERLIDLMLPSLSKSAANKAITNLAVMQLKDLKSRIEKLLEKSGDQLDTYSRAHLVESSERMEKALDAEYIYNQTPAMPNPGSFLFFGNSPEQESGLGQPTE